MVVQVIIYGPRYCLVRKFYMKLELLLQIGNLVLFIRYLDGSIGFPHAVRFLEVIIMIRLLKILNVLKELKQFRLILDTIRALLRPFYNLMLVIFIVYYIWA